MSLSLKNGRFVKKKVLERISSGVTRQFKTRKRKLQEMKDDSHVEEMVAKKPSSIGKRIMDYEVFAKNFKCKNCSVLLDLEKVEEEKRIGLHFIIIIRCDACGTSNKVHAGTYENKVSHINASVAYGAIHSGAGQTALNKILVCADKLYKKYEDMVGHAIEQEAKESCKQAVAEERQLVIKNIMKLTAFLNLLSFD